MRLDDVPVPSQGLEDPGDLSTFLVGDSLLKLQ